MRVSYESSGVFRYGENILASTCNLFRSSFFNCHITLSPEWVISSFVNYKAIFCLCGVIVGANRRMTSFRCSGVLNCVRLRSSSSLLDFKVLIPGRI